MFFEKYVDKKKQFRWRLKSRNGKIIASGESYIQEAKCDHAIELMRGLQDIPVKVLTTVAGKTMSKTIRKTKQDTPVAISVQG